MRILQLVSSAVGSLVIVCGLWSLPVGRCAEPSKPKLPDGYVEEAPLPAGFPAPGPVGQVIEKSYPVTRSFSATGDGAFLKCFGYLAEHQYKMTAPVVMEYKPGAENKGPETRSRMPIPIERMHFLLEKNSLDEPKEAGSVKVADMPKMRVLSIAQQEPVTAEAIKAAQEKLLARLKELGDLRSAGQFRLLGYNSPLIPRNKNYWEVQLPVENRVP